MCIQTIHSFDRQLRLVHAQPVPVPRADGSSRSSRQKRSDHPRGDSGELHLYPSHVAIRNWACCCLGIEGWKQSGGKEGVILDFFELNLELTFPLLPSLSSPSFPVDLLRIWYPQEHRHLSWTWSPFYRLWNQHSGHPMGHGKGSFFFSPPSRS